MIIQVINQRLVTVHSSNREPEPYFEIIGRNDNRLYCLHTKQYGLNLKNGSIIDISGTFAGVGWYNDEVYTSYIGKVTKIININP